jgi:hypothetical protein
MYLLVSSQHLAGGEEKDQRYKKAYYEGKRERPRNSTTIVVIIIIIPSGRIGGVRFIQTVLHHNGLILIIGLCIASQMNAPPSASGATILILRQSSPAPAFVQK